MFDKTRHYPTQDIKWDKGKVKQAIQSIVDDATHNMDDDSAWSCHPMDNYGGSNFYWGSSGVLWAINYLNSTGFVETGFDISNPLNRAHTDTLESFHDAVHSSNSSYLFGALPILMLQYKLTPSESTKDEIFTSITQNNTEPVRELMWGIAGSMLAANFMHQWTGEQRWIDIFQLQANRLLEEWEAIPDVGYLWSPELYGNNFKYLGPVHGFCGNLIPLIKGRQHLPEKLYEEICVKAMGTAVNTAISDNQYANWVPRYEPESQQSPSLVQHCHGAPGMVSALSELPTNLSGEFDQLLEKGGELTWRAGPLKKGSNLCHGTGGNGYAFLKLFERTQNELWLDRAQTFAMNAIEQYQTSKKLYQQGRYSLWTGDAGLATYLVDCLNEKPQFPTIDIF